LSNILGDLGKVSHEVAEALALGEYEKYRVEEDKKYVSDFDAFVDKTTRLPGKGKKKK